MGSRMGPRWREAVGRRLLVACLVLAVGLGAGCGGADSTAGDAEADATANGDDGPQGDGTDDDGAAGLESATAADPSEPDPGSDATTTTSEPATTTTTAPTTTTTTRPPMPDVVRGLRVSRYVAADPEMYTALLDLAEATTTNALVFDTKDETGTVLYDTEVAEAARLGAIDPVYDPTELLAQAVDRGLYPITRVVTFEDRVWVADPEAKLAGHWVDAGNQANWAYPIDLAEEACRLGFAEIQFDYVRFPAGRTAEVAASRVPRTSDERAAVIGAFLRAARERLEPLGCGVSAAIFGIVMSSPGDEGIGQVVEVVGAEVDAISPMLYPSHYGPGWLGFADPNDHPGPVIAHALDGGMPRVPPGTQMRPWIQGFYYDGAQIGAQIAEAEARGAGWLLWNASGNYRADWLPPAG